MRRFMQYAAAGVLACLCTSPAAFSGPKQADAWEQRARQRKADYTFMEAQRLRGSGDKEAEFHLLRRSSAMAPTDTYLGAAQVKYLFASNSDELFQEGFRLSAIRFADEPADMDNSLLYAHIIEAVNGPVDALTVWEKLDSIFPTKADVTFRYADIMLQSENDSLHPKAVKLLRRLETTEGRHPAITARLMTLMIENGDTAGALAELPPLFKSAPMSSEAYTLAAAAYNSLQMPDSALYYYNRACEVDSTNGDAWINRADYILSLGDSAAYKHDIHFALLETDLNPEVKNQILTEFVRNYLAPEGVHNDILELVGDMVAKYPTDKNYRELLTNLYFLDQRYPEAAEQQDYIVSLYPADADNWLRLISLNQLAEFPDKTIAAASDAMERFPDNPSILLSKARALLAFEKYDEGINELSRILPLIDRNDHEAMADAYQMQAFIYDKMGMEDKVIEAYEKVLQETPHDAMSLNNLAYNMAISGGDLDRAEELSRKSLLYESDSPIYQDTYAWIKFLQREYATAREYIDKALTSVDTTPFEEEATLPEKADKDILEGSAGEIYDHAGDIYFMLQEPDKALLLWRKALEYDPDNTLIKKKVQHKAYFNE